MKHLVIISTIVCLYLSSYGQFEQNLIRYTIDDGLPSNVIYDMLQDQKGFMWFATDKGVAKFDGYNFKVFTTADGLPHNDVWGLHEDEQGRIIVLSFFQGITFIENDKVRTLKLTNARGSDYMISNGKLWKGTSKYLLGIDLATNEVEHIDRHYAAYFYPHAFLFQKKRDEYFLHGTDVALPSLQNNLYVFNGEKRRTIPLLGNHLKSARSKERAITDHYFYYWSNDYLYQFDFYTEKSKSISLYELGGHHSSSINYLGSYLWRIDDKVLFIDSTFNINNKEEFIIPNNIKVTGSIVRDNEKNWWIITADNGVVLVTAQSQRTKQFTPPTPSVKKIQLDENGNIFFINQLATYPYSKDQFSLLTAKGKYKPLLENLGEQSLSTIDIVDRHIMLNRASGNKPYSMIWMNKEELQSNKEISFATHIIHKETKAVQASYPFLRDQNLLLEKYKSSFSIKNSFVDRKTKDIWLATNGIISVFQYAPIDRMYTFFPSMIFGRAYAVAGDQQDIFVGRTDGLFIVDRDSLDFDQYRENVFYIKDQSVLPQKINDLDIADDKRLWIGTDGYGLHTCTDCREKIEQVEGTENDIIQELFIKSENEIWTATANGLKRIDVLSWQPFETKVTTFNTIHGLPTRIINSVYVTDTMAYVATQKGITFLPTDILKKDTTQPILHIRQMAINRQDTTIQKSYRLKHNDNNLSIGYVGLSYKSQKNITYRYRMLGIDTEWQTTELLEREYPQLVAGTYTFEVQAIDLNGIASDVQRIQFTILKPWWQQIWFFVLLLAVISGLIYFIFQLRFRQLAKREEEKRTVEKQFADLELQALQAQMNPHFIFNSLSAIQNFILRNNIMAADQYLVKFSRLMRSYLDASKEKFTTIDDELKLLKLYVELEQVRFKNKFDVKWLIDDEVDIYAEIPTMLIQPFVENAINHGLNFKEEKGLLEIIIIEIDEDNIKCTIKDNGVGRVAAKTLQAQTRKAHKSRGMQIIEERLRTLELINDSSIDIQIKDLYDGSMPMGTQVDISIKLIYEE